MFRDIKEDINESRNIPCPDCLLHSPSFAALDVVLYLEPKSWCLRKLSAVNKCLYKKEDTVVSNLEHKLTVTSSDGKEHSTGAAWWTLIFKSSGEAQCISKKKNSQHS